MLQILFSFIILFGLNHAFAWGPKGQEITVAVAEQYLTPNARQKIKDLVGVNQTLSRFSTWADQARNSDEWNYTGSWHFINVDDSGNYDHGTDQTPDDILNAIQYSIVKIRSQAPQAEKLTWLKFLIHLIGDLHQPMHVGRPQDRGGNSTNIKYGKVMNLHYLWDSAFIEKRSLSVQNYVQKLKSENRPMTELSTFFSPETVINENFYMRKFLYSFQNGVIDNSYENQAFVIIDERLWTGGLRLASLLNSIFK